MLPAASQCAKRRDYNEHRPHSAIGNLTPAEFAAS
ncbi:integrase core domain-containing protein [Pseudomonas aeruginosa]